MGGEGAIGQVSCLPTVVFHLLSCAQLAATRRDAALNSGIGVDRQRREIVATFEIGVSSPLETGRISYRGVGGGGRGVLIWSPFCPI